VQCALLLEDPVRARKVGQDLAEQLRNLHPDSVLSPALGGVIIGHEVAAALGVPFRFTERKGEEMGFRRGFTLRQGERVVIVEDVVTTGRSTLETAALATSKGARVVGVGAIIDRSVSRNPFDVPFRSLLRLDLPSYPPNECPACRAGAQAPEKPGSRPDAATATADAALGRTEGAG
jgi:orotate phosphoribosyltransferase